MTLAISIAFIIAGVLLLYFGAHWLVTGATRLATQLGVRPIVIGLTIVAFGTSAPELFASLYAQLFLGTTSVAVGNVVGSNIYNIGLVLGLSALVYPISIHSVVVRREAPICIVTTLVFLIFMWGGVIQRAEGIVLFVGILLYVVLQYVDAQRTRETKKVLGEYAELVEEKKERAMPINLLLIMVGSIALAVGADFLVENAVKIGRMLGISERIIGLTAVAVGTSLPELATAVVAAIKKHPDLVVGNVVGSNIFNILLIIGSVGSLEPLHFDALLATLDGPFLLILTIVMAILLRTGRTLERWEGGVLLGASVVYTAYLFS